MNETERAAVALITGVLTRRIKIGSESRIGGYGRIKEWMRNKYTDFDVRYISGVEVDMYNSLNQVKIHNIGEFTRDYVRLQVYQKQHAAEIILNKIRHQGDEVTGYVKRDSNEMYEFVYKINEYRDIRLEDNERGSDEYRGQRQYQIDF